MPWDPVQYGRYADERARPFLDLIARVHCEAPRRVVDLGCGPGSLTALLAERWPNAIVEGLDSSHEMIAAARPLATDRLSFRVEDVRDWLPLPDADVVVSNAVLQWVPDHLDLLRRWAAALPPTGWIAVQVPGNYDSPSHVLMREVAQSPRWADRVGQVASRAVAEPSDYADLLLTAGLHADVWESTYVHVLHGADPVLEWVRGTGLRPILAALDEASAAEFVTEYAARLREAYPATPLGTLFPFRRIFMVGSRS